MKCFRFYWENCPVVKVDSKDQSREIIDFLSDGVGTLWLWNWITARNNVRTISPTTTSTSNVRQQVSRSWRLPDWRTALRSLRLPSPAGRVWRDAAGPPRPDHDGSRPCQLHHGAGRGGEPALPGLPGLPLPGPPVARPRLGVEQRHGGLRGELGLQELHHQHGQRQGQQQLQQ